MHSPFSLRIYSVEELPRELLTMQVQFPRKISNNTSLACSKVVLSESIPSSGEVILVNPVKKVISPSGRIWNGEISKTPSIKIGFSIRKDSSILALLLYGVEETSWPSLNQNCVGRGIGWDRWSSTSHNKSVKNSSFLTTSMYAAVICSNVSNIQIVYCNTIPFYCIAENLWDKIFAKPSYLSIVVINER